MQARNGTRTRFLGGVAALGRKGDCRTRDGVAKCHVGLGRYEEGELRNARRRLRIDPRCHDAVDVLVGHHGRKALVLKLSWKLSKAPDYGLFDPAGAVHAVGPTAEDDVVCSACCGRGSRLNFRCRLALTTFGQQIQQSAGTLIDLVVCDLESRDLHPDVRCEIVLGAFLLQHALYDHMRHVTGRHPWGHHRPAIGDALGINSCLGYSSIALLLRALHVLRFAQEGGLLVCFFQNICRTLFVGVVAMLLGGCRPNCGCPNLRWRGNGLMPLFVRYVARPHFRTLLVRKGLQARHLLIFKAQLALKNIRIRSTRISPILRSGASAEITVGPHTKRPLIWPDLQPTGRSIKPATPTSSQHVRRGGWMISRASSNEERLSIAKRAGKRASAADSNDKPACANVATGDNPTRTQHAFAMVRPFDLSRHPHRRCNRQYHRLRPSPAKKSRQTPLPPE